MRLLQYEAENKPKGKRKDTDTVARVYFSKQGVISFNETAAKVLEIKEGDKIAFAQDEETPKDWYFYKTDKGFTIRKKPLDKGFCLNHCALVREYNEKMNLSHENRSFLLAGEPTMTAGDKTKYFCLLVKEDV